MITHQTITDEQIEALRLQAAAVNDWDTVNTCAIVLDKITDDCFTIQEARAECAQQIATRYAVAS